MIQEQQRPVVGSQQRGGGGGGVRSKPGQVRTGRGGSVGSRTASDDLMSRSMADRKALLGETYYDSAKKSVRHLFPFFLYCIGCSVRFNLPLSYAYTHIHVLLRTISMTIYNCL